MVTIGALLEFLQNVAFGFGATIVLILVIGASMPARTRVARAETSARSRR
jgi:hypothetical protein